MKSLEQRRSWKRELSTIWLICHHYNRLWSRIVICLFWFLLLYWGYILLVYIHLSIFLCCRFRLWLLRNRRGSWVINLSFLALSIFYIILILKVWLLREGIFLFIIIKIKCLLCTFFKLWQFLQNLSLASSFDILLIWYHWHIFRLVVIISFKQ